MQSRDYLLMFCWSRLGSTILRAGDLALGAPPKAACLGRAMGLRKFYGDLMGMGPSHGSA